MQIRYNPITFLSYCSSKMVLQEFLCLTTKQAIINAIINIQKCNNQSQNNENHENDKILLHMCNIYPQLPTRIQLLHQKLLIFTLIVHIINAKIPSTDLHNIFIILVCIGMMVLKIGKKRNEYSTVL